MKFLCIIRFRIASVLVAIASAFFTVPNSGFTAGETIEYPGLPLPDPDRHEVTILLEHGKSQGDAGLSLILFYRSKGTADIPASISDFAKIAVRLHTYDDGVILPINEARPSWTNVMGSASHPYLFPSGSNTLEEGWIEIRLTERTFWIEVPYGFLGKPSDATHADAERGAPQFPATIKDLTQRDYIIRWNKVDYDLGEIQNHWRLSVKLSNPFDAKAEITLYRDDSQIGKSAFLWDLHTPITSVAILMGGGRKLMAHPRAIKLHSDGMRRTDTHYFNRDGSDEKGRKWGTIVIKVDEESYKCQIPSSLFKYVHGITDPYNKKWPKATVIRSPRSDLD